MENYSSLDFILIAFGVSILGFFILRDVMLWYYKINKRIELQEETNRLLKILVEEKESVSKKQKITINPELEKQTDVNNPNVLKDIINNLEK
jgi:hypothetical protein